MTLVFLLLILGLQSLPGEVTPGQMFLRATKDDDLQTIETLLSAGFDPNGAVDGHGYKPLWYAIASGRTEVVELLLAAHADPNAKPVSDPYYATPLRLALRQGNLRMARALIEAGAHVDAKENNGRTALFDEIRDVHLDGIRLLIEEGADVNARDAEGASPLDNAVWSGALDTVALLVAHGAHLNEPDTQTGATPINEAAFMGRTPVVQFLLQLHPDLGIPDKRGFRPLDNAIGMRKQDCALLLLDAESKEQVTPQFLGNAMEAAIKKGEPAVVEALLRHGAPANSALPSGAMPLDAAAFAGSEKVVRLLLDHGADPNVSATLLEDASLKGFASIAGLLLDHGAQVNRINADSGATALYAAASFGRGEVVKLLLDRGANPNLCGRNHKSPYQAALENGYHDVASMIKLHGGAGSCGP